MMIPITHLRSALLLLLASIVAPTALYAGVEPEPFHFAQVGLARLQVAHLNIYVPKPPPDDTQPPPDDENQCHVALSFQNGAGQAFVDAAGLPVAAEFDLAPGQSAALDLTAAQAFQDRSRRVDIRPIVTFKPPPDDGTPDPCQDAVPTLELFDALTGRTEIVLYGLQAPPDDTLPPPDDGAPAPGR